MDFHPALLGCRVKYHHGEVRAAINGKGGKLQLNHTKLRMMHALKAFALPGHIIAAPEGVKFRALTAEFGDEPLVFRR